MEFPFNINSLFGNEICLIEKDLTPYRTSPLNIREYKSQLCQVIDKMGEASAKAQGLHGAITTAHRLQLTDHRLYIMKDASANGGKGAVIGFIKVGRKRLFIYDRNGVHHEMEPLCTLDFYVHESRQRMGCGKKLFEFMLKAERVQPYQLAIDRPSHKFLTFLNKHYKLKTTVPQVNNFVVFESFFRDKSGSAMDRKTATSLKPPSHPYRRLNSRELPVDGILSRLSDMPSRPPSGGMLPRATEEVRESDTAKDSCTHFPQSTLPGDSAHSSTLDDASVTQSSTQNDLLINTGLTSPSRSYQRDLRPSRLGLSRSSSAPPLRSPTNDMAPGSCPPTADSLLADSGKDPAPLAVLPPITSHVTVPGAAPSVDTEATPSGLPELSSVNLLAWHDGNVQRVRRQTIDQQKEALSNVPLQRQSSLENGRNVDRHQNPLNVQAGSAAQFAMGAHNAMYSRHGNTPPTPTQGRHGSTPPTPSHGRNGDTHGEFRTNAINNMTNNVTLDVSKRIIGGKEPPLRRRDGPSEEYQRLFTTDSYQDRRGHLKVAPRADTETESYKHNRTNYQKSNSSEVVVTTNNSLAPSGDKPLKSQTLGSGWNIFGVPPNPRTGNYNKFQQTKLW